MPRVSFYFSAHEDDWQLFMNPAAFDDVLSGSKVVFVHVTAGDAGLGTGTGGRKTPYYLAREHGAQSAIHFMADADDRAPLDEGASPAIVNGHPLRRLGYRNTVAYFLRLPDGSPEGQGYAETGFQSLERLNEEELGALEAIDGTTTYRGWHDLVATLRSLIDVERAQAPIDLHVPELDPAINPNDHPDHVMTAKLALEAAAHLKDARRFHHPGYNCGALPENLAGRERDMKCAVYAVTLAGIMASGHPTSWRHYDESFVGRNYCRVG